MNDSFDEEVEGVNVIDINPVHHLLSFGLDGPSGGVVQFWDPRSRSRVGILRLPAAQITPLSSTSTALSITALASKSDGLSFAVGTSTGYTLLYDIRSTRPFAIKDQGYGLPVKDVLWVEGGSKMAGDGNLVITADSKVIKIWDRNTVSRYIYFLSSFTR
jgi:ribosome biogenesis protein ENP2